MMPEEQPFARVEHDPSPDVPLPPPAALPAVAMSRPVAVAMLVVAWTVSAWPCIDNLNLARGGDSLLAFLVGTVAPSLALTVPLFLILRGTDSARWPNGYWLFFLLVLVYGAGNVLVLFAIVISGPGMT